MATLAHFPSLQSDGSAEPIIRMGPGQGEDSYVKNSSVQSHCLQVVEELLWHGIRSASRFPEIGNAGNVLRVADLGCATGDNTVGAVDKLLENLEALWESKAGQLQLQPFPKDIEVFFSDLASNDFNTLFRSLSPNGSGNRRYFAAGVPGSFYGPLFPAASIHAFTCFSALHWLSRIPPEVLDKGSPAFNLDRVHVWGANPAVQRAFSNQSSKDLTAFLTNRSVELVPGGFLAVAMCAKPDEQYHRALALDCFSDIFHELAVVGAIPRGLIETYNIPGYFPTIAQLRRAVEEVGLFDIHVLQSSGDSSFYPAHICEEYRADLRKFARDSVLFWKAAFHTSMEEHFGVELSNLAFERYEHHVQTLHLQPGRNVDDYFAVHSAVALLTRK